MDIEKAKNRCNELVKVEHVNWVGISNQEAIEVLLNELDKDNNIISDLQNEVTLKQCELDKKDKIIDSLLTEITAVNSGRYEYMDNDKVLEIFTKKVEDK